MARNTHYQFMRDLKAEVESEGYIFVSYATGDGSLWVRPKERDNSGQLPPVEMYVKRRMGEGTNNSFTRTWPPGFEFVGTQS